jgi:CheY-like chemotaxis protein
MEAALMAGVLVVEDEALIVELLKSMLEDMGLTMCATTATAAEAVTLAAEHTPDLVLLDVRLRGNEDGIDLAIALRHRTKARIVFITGSRDAVTVRRLEQFGAPVLFKPMRLQEFRKTIQQALTF